MYSVDVKIEELFCDWCLLALSDEAPGAAARMSHGHNSDNQMMNVNIYMEEGTFSVLVSNLHKKIIYRSPMSAYLDKYLFIENIVNISSHSSISGLRLFSKQDLS